MAPKRILSLWFPRLGAERLLRAMRGLPDKPFAVVEQTGQMQRIASVSVLAQGAGVYPGQPLRDALAICPQLATQARDAAAEAAFLTRLRRWAGQFAPLVAEEPPDALTLDITGCAHLFGGEAAMVERIGAALEGMGLSVQAGLADTPGAAWALARHAGGRAATGRSGDAIQQEARATRSRAAARPRHAPGPGATTFAPAIAAIGQTHSALARLPVAALRLDPATVAELTRLGLRHVGDLTGQPRAALARRFGKGLVLRLDQALGSAPEPISPARPDTAFATRLSLPEPIGLEADMLAALDRLLPRLCEMLHDKRQGARILRLEAYRSDGQRQDITLTLARASHDPARIRPLLAMRLDQIDAGFGIDMFRLEALRTEPLHDKQSSGHLEAARAAASRAARDTAIEDLTTRLGARIGMEAITRHHPGNSHIPEKAAQILAAAWSEPAPDWPAPAAPRPALLWRPEPVTAPDTPHPPARFRWRRRDLALACAQGPERIAPEWWLDEPDWRSGTRDYWIVTTACGSRLWLYFAHGAAMSRGWFCHGSFA
ncbi:DNA polymerase Y family protein [Seohaeicola sp. SP36]|uniref:Y-family DNA polymerase n=1 Tax=unclassified Seohaeicola TaxID=2641111 RepID=UPI00237BBD42|nr:MULTISPECIES: DNA polymerase Y family protein [unclassified Seohaeicola]MDD9705928.1 DNA polymerase Y family protein [Seohaeicola sp. 4SK31]MDD9736216.1 DNA polymerase Y family protein [Seohaeicola sp. SP36]